MKKDSQLFNLINSLEQSEKRYFRIFANKQGGAKNYIRLFDIFEKQKEFNAENLKIQYKELSFSKSLHVTKNYLYKLILKSLRSFHEANSPEIKIDNVISEITILTKKGLPNDALKLLKEAKKIAEKFDLNVKINSLQILELSLSHAYKTKEIEKKVKDLITEIEHIDAKIQTENRLYAANTLWTLRSRKNELDILSKENILQYWKETLALLPDFSQLSFLGKVYFLSILNYKAKSEGNDSEADRTGKMLMSIWKENLQMIEFQPNVYLIYANNYLITSGQLKNWEEFPPLLAELKQLPIKNFNQAGEAFQVIAFKELYYLMNTQKFEEAEASVAYIDEGMKKYKAKIHDARRLTFHYNISILYFMQEKYDEALERILRIINHPKTEHRLDLQRIAYLFELIYHYELGNMLLVSSMSVSLGRRLLRTGKLSIFEKTVLKRLGALSKAADKTEKRKIYTIFKEELDEIAEENSNQLGVEELQIWIDKKL